MAICCGYIAFDTTVGHELVADIIALTLPLLNIKPNILKAKIAFTYQSGKRILSNSAIFFEKNIRLCYTVSREIEL